MTNNTGLRGCEREVGWAVVGCLQERFVFLQPQEVKACCMFAVEQIFGMGDDGLGCV